MSREEKQPSLGDRWRNFKDRKLNRDRVIEATRNARESLHLLSNGPQESLVTFKANSRSVVDLTQLRSGAVLRVDTRYSFNPNYYADRAYYWFVMGLNDGKGKYVLFEVVPDEDDIAMYLLPTLTEHAYFNLVQRTLTKDTFDINEALRILYGEDRASTCYPLHSLDIMHNGIKTKVPVENKVRVQITPAFETI